MDSSAVTRMSLFEPQLKAIAIFILLLAGVVVGVLAFWMGTHIGEARGQGERAELIEENSNLQIDLVDTQLQLRGCIIKVETQCEDL